VNVGVGDMCGREHVQCRNWKWEGQNQTEFFSILVGTIF